MVVPKVEKEWRVGSSAGRSIDGARKTTQEVSADIVIQNVIAERESAHARSIEVAGRDDVRPVKVAGEFQHALGLTVPHRVRQKNEG